MKNNPIGIFDSGVGGLSVLQSIRARLPNEDLIYIADFLYVPYGDKSQDLITQRAVALTQFLLQKNAKAIVVACNTATVSAIQELRSLFSIPIIGIEPGVKPAGLATKSGTIGVLATQRTLASHSFNNLLNRLVSHRKVELQACPGLVEQVEKRALNGKETRRLLEKYVVPLLEKGADTLVLGCTHYPFLIPLIRDIAGKHIEVIDTGDAVAKQLGLKLHENALLSNQTKPGTEQFWSSAVLPNAQQNISELWGEPVTLSIMPTKNHIPSYTQRALT